MLTQTNRVTIQRKVSSPNLADSNRGLNRLRRQREHNFKDVIEEQEEQKKAIDASMARNKKNEEPSETMNHS